MHIVSGATLIAHDQSTITIAMYDEPQIIINHEIKLQSSLLKIVIFDVLVCQAICLFFNVQSQNC